MRFLAILTLGCCACGAADAGDGDVQDSDAFDYQAVTCTAAELNAGGTCGCEFILPIDPGLLQPTHVGTIWEEHMWPFGVHGGGHPEGHPGWDFISATDQDVLMPADGAIYEISSSGGEDPEGNLVGIGLKCGLRIYFGPMRPDLSVVEVGRVIGRGTRLGGMAFVSGRFFLHFGLSARSETDDLPGTACPSVLYDASTNATLENLVALSGYTEKSARMAEFACADGTNATFELPAEDKLCVPRLDEPTRSAVSACLGPNLKVW